MSALDDVARMLVMVPWFRERPGATLDEAAQAFGVPAAQIRSDLGHLDFCGTFGLGGGALFDVSIVSDRVVIDMADELDAPLRLTPQEALSLLLVGEAAAAALGDVLPALGSALAKLRTAVGVPADVSVTLEDDGTIWLEALRSALDKGLRVSFAYRGRGDDAPVERTVDPWVLVVARGEWYLQGHDATAAAMRTFRLDRIAKLTVTQTPATEPRPAGVLPPPDYAAGADDTTFVVEVGSTGRWLVDAITADATEPLDGDRIRVTFRSDAPDWIDRLLLVAGGDITIIQPAEADAAMRARARRVLALYS